MMTPKRLENGNLLVPARAEGPDGVIGDGVTEAEPGSELYRLWLPEVEKAERRQRAAEADG
jgi:hypothetical protein